MSGEYKVYHHALRMPGADYAPLASEDLTSLRKEGWRVIQMTAFVSGQAIGAIFLLEREGPT